MSCNVGVGVGIINVIESLHLKYDRVHINWCPLQRPKLFT